MLVNINNQSPNDKTSQFSKDIAHIEIDPKAKKPKRIPFLRIITYAVIFIVIASVLLYVVLLASNQDKFQKLSKDVSSEVESKLKAYPRPLPNACGEDILMCASGNVVEKTEKNCEFSICPESTSDMTKFWKVSSSEQEYIRIYENLDLKYKFNLVKNWDFVGKDYGFIIYSPNYDCESITSGKECNGTIMEMISSNTTAKTDVEDWYASRENHFRINSDVSWPVVFDIKEISGIKAILVENALNNLTYFFIYDNTVFALKMISASNPDFKNSLPIMNEIVSSFKFTNTIEN